MRRCTGFPTTVLFSCPAAEMGMCIYPNGQMERRQFPRKSVSARRFKPLSWTTRHNLRPLWGKNLAQMGACGLAAYRPKLFRSGGGLAVGPCAPAPVPMCAQGSRYLHENSGRKTTRFFWLFPRFPHWGDFLTPDSARGLAAYRLELFRPGGSAGRRPVRMRSQVRLRLRSCAHAYVRSHPAEIPAKKSLVSP